MNLFSKEIEIRIYTKIGFANDFSSDRVFRLRSKRVLTSILIFRLEE